MSSSKIIANYADSQDIIDYFNSLSINTQQIILDLIHTAQSLHYKVTLAVKYCVFDIIDKKVNDLGPQKLVLDILVPSTTFNSNNFDTSWIPKIEETL